MTILAYIKQLQEVEEYAFSWNEIIENIPSPVSTLRKELARLSVRGEIVNIRQGFYVIIPPRYAPFGKLPVALYVDKLFRFLSKLYYVGLYSAATLHGASHQRVQQEYIITVPPALRDIKKQKFKIRFFNSVNWPEHNLIQQRSDAGRYVVSSPALTAVDLVHHHPKIGGLNRILANLAELAPLVSEEDLRNLLQWYPYKSALQRFGYLMEQLPTDRWLADRVFNHLSGSAYYPVLLSPDVNTKPGTTGNRWKVDVNILLESDL